MKIPPRPLLVAAAAALLAAPALTAQERAPLGIDRRPVTLGIATINPFAIILGGFNGDVELNFGSGFTGALSATFSGGEIDHSTVDATFRYYPSEQFPRGFSVGASIGRTRFNKGASDETEGPAFGFIAGHNWVLGRSDRLVIATGFGLKRVWDSKDNPDPVAVIPTGRLGIGLAF